MVEEMETEEWRGVGTTRRLGRRLSNTWNIGIRIITEEGEGKQESYGEDIRRLFRRYPGG
jgi:hypothetical protein